MSHDGESTLVRAPRCAPLGAFLAAARARSALTKLLRVPEDFDALEARWDGGEGDGRALALGTAVGTCADGARRRSDDVYGVALRAVNGRERLDASDAAADDGWGRMERECRHAFFNGLKEATYATRASAARAMTMSSEDADAMWDAVVRGDADTLRRAEKVGDAVREGRKRAVVPVRVYETRGDDFANATFASAPASVERRGTTVGDALRAFGVDVDAVEIVLAQGVEVGLDFDLEQTYEALRHADAFLYLVAHVASTL